ncbi:putative centromere DNA-binding protein complex CBF3 subunit domain-containing protein, partial [Phytophthora infestans]
VTHIRRTSSCVIAEANGAFEASIRRGRRWNNEKMEGCYLTTLPRVVVRGLAGFNANGEFFLPRAESSIPETLRGAHALFTRPDYQVFANQLLSRLQKTSDTGLIPTVRAALPILANVVESSFASTVLRLTAIEEYLRSTHTL